MSHRTTSDEVAARLAALAEARPLIDSTIVGRLIERCPEILSDLLDDIEAGH